MNGTSVKGDSVAEDVVDWGHCQVEHQPNILQLQTTNSNFFNSSYYYSYVYYYYYYWIVPLLSVLVKMKVKVRTA